jgi:hypothetical protein
MNFKCSNCVDLGHSLLEELSILEKNDSITSEMPTVGKKRMRRRGKTIHAKPLDNIDMKAWTRYLVIQKMLIAIHHQSEKIFVASHQKSRSIFSRYDLQVSKSSLVT